MARWWRPEICSRQAGQVAEKVILLALNFVHLIRADLSEFCRKQMWLPFQSLPDFKNQKWCIYGRYHDWFYGWWICLENEWKWMWCDLLHITYPTQFETPSTLSQNIKTPPSYLRLYGGHKSGQHVWLGMVANVTIDKIHSVFFPRILTIWHQWYSPSMKLWAE